MPVLGKKAYIVFAFSGWLCCSTILISRYIPEMMELNIMTNEMKNMSKIDTKVDKRQDDECKRVFEWSMIDSWTDLNAHQTRSTFNMTSLPEKKTLTSKRTLIPLNKGKRGEIKMSIMVQNNNLDLTVVDMFPSSKTAMSEPFQVNLWHRMISQYEAFVGVQTARYRYGLNTTDTVYLFDCERRSNTIRDLPPEWDKIGNTTCDESIKSHASVIITPPIDGLLWDLAWNRDLECYNSDMFKAFASQFVDKSSAMEVVGCWIGRKGRPIRAVTNKKDLFKMMHEVFPRVRVIELTRNHSTDETIDLLYECRVLFGVHGAGQMNAIFARPGVSVVEIVGKTGVAYYKNINMLLGQHYEAIYGDDKTINQNFQVDLVEARDALIRAKDQAEAWIKEHDVKW